MRWRVRRRSRNTFPPATPDDLDETGSAVEECGRRWLGEIAEEIKSTAFRVTRVGELIGREVAARLGVAFGIVDLSLAPTPQVGDSVGEILQAMGVARIGAPTRRSTTAGIGWTAAEPLTRGLSTGVGALWARSSCQQPAQGLDSKPAAEPKTRASARPSL